jgi:soluble lytic murein transglycosylase-like protein
MLPLMGLVCCVILGINGAVRALGGDVTWWSVVRLEERAEALARLGQHQLRTIWQGPGTEPEAALRAAAARHGVSVRLVREVARAESDFVPTRISGTGAMGLMQLMPGTADELGVLDPFDAEQNADGGARYLRQLLKAYRGDVRRALAAYNAGPSRVPSVGPVHMPAETRGYVAKISAGL